MIRFFNRKMFSCIIAILVVCYLIFSNIYYKNINEMEFREIAWNELTLLEKNEVIIDWQDARVEVINLKRGSILFIPVDLPNEKRQAEGKILKFPQKSILVEFETAIFHDKRVYIDPITKVVIGHGAR